MAALYTRHSLLLQTAFSELKRLASEQSFVLVGSPGSVGHREVKGSRFLYRQFYDARGVKAAEYLGPAESPEAMAKASAIRGQIERASALAREARILGQQGYVRTDSRTGAIVGSFFNHGLFRAGAVLVGSHAYGALLNDQGIRAAAFATEDVDLARDRRLALDADSDADVPAGARKVDFAQILADSTVPLSPVPGFGKDAKSTSYKVPGADRLRVDLLVPATGNEVSVKAVPELGAYAAALPHLRALLENPIDSVLLTREGAIAIRVPRPEAFVWHKMQLPTLRGASDKKTKDVTQAGILFAALGEDAPDALASEHASLTAPAKKRVLAGARQVLAMLEGANHERAASLLRELVPAVRSISRAARTTRGNRRG